MGKYRQKAKASHHRAGACQCGTVRFQVPFSPLTYYACHCTDCRAQSASAFGLSYLIHFDQFVLKAGSLNSKTVALANGNSKISMFCPDCGTRIYHALSDETQPISVKAGTLTGLDDLIPVASIWVKSALPWVRGSSPGIRCFDGQPDEQLLIDLWRDLRAD